MKNVCTMNHGWVHPFKNYRYHSSKYVHIFNVKLNNTVFNTSIKSIFGNIKIEQLRTSNAWFSYTFATFLYFSVRIDKSSSHAYANKKPRLGSDNCIKYKPSNEACGYFVKTADNCIGCGTCRQEVITYESSINIFSQRAIYQVNTMVTLKHKSYLFDSRSSNWRSSRRTQ